MSGECLCGAMAQPNEAKLILHHYYHVGRRIQAWEEIVASAYRLEILDIREYQCRWGHANGKRISDDQLELPGFEIGHMCGPCQGKTDIARLQLGLEI